MISDNDSGAVALRAELATLVASAGMKQEVRDLCVKLLDTLTEPRFPGVLVPSMGKNAALQVDVAAQTSSEWRRLRPVLQAFAGPTLTGFTGLPQAFDEDDEIGQMLLAIGPAVTSVIPLPSEPKLRIAALKALTQAVATVVRAPNLHREAPVPTSWLLAQFQDHLNLGRRDAAAAVLQRLRADMRLDGLNIRFLEANLLAHFENWQSLVEMPGFADLTRSRKTPGMASMLLSALYHVSLEVKYEEASLQPLLEKYADSVQALARPMLLATGVKSMAPEAVRVCALEVLSNDARGDLRDALAGRSTELGWLADHFKPVPTPAKTAISTPLDTARSALVDGTLLDGIATVETLRRALTQLSPDDRAKLLGSLPLGPLAEEHSSSTNQAIPLPASWGEWFIRLTDPTFDAYLDVARKGAEEWPWDNSMGDPLRVKALKDAIEAAQNDPLSVARITEAMPYLVNWLQLDADFPRPAYVPIYAELLLLTAIDSARSKQIFQSSQILVSALLDCGLDKEGYNSLLESIDLIAGDGFGVDMAYWLFEIVESLYRCPSPDAAARETFSHSLLARLSPLYSRLSGLQRAALHQLAAELGWSIDVAQEVEGQVQDDSFAEKLNGQSIAIYSLTEDASRQAKKAIENLNPNVKVDINADHVGTQRLKAMSENADLFVISWRSAKHAATNFIRANRGTRPLLYARGKGFSSILRALEDHLLQPS
ncbi:protein DpdD [Salipiger bermudensis]|uniref:protein DpdD n=1 Tax=Salipiger bermudensis TaxID=344736 RepID=UPI001A8D0ED3|nr:protein DpdD [Salipiger bermudensis]MBN9677992.1 hypothetical protein [Salipiger bermudensis]